MGWRDQVTIHFENAAYDPFVPPDAARAFLDKLRPMYGESADRLTLYETPDMDHQYIEPMWEHSLQWFARQI